MNAFTAGPSCRKKEEKRLFSKSFSFSTAPALDGDAHPLPDLQHLRLSVAVVVGFAALQHSCRYFHQKFIW